MKIRVDHDICEANQICEQVAPEVFRLRDDDLLQVLTPRPAPEHVEAARLAVHRCPRQALHVTED